MAYDEQLADAERRLREIDRIVYVPTPPGTKAYTHFQRDFDQIRALTKPWHGIAPIAGQRVEQS